MAVRDVLLYPHPSLKHVARALGPEDTELAEQTGPNLVDTMRANQGCVGIAAPQLGALVRMLVVDLSEHPRATTNNGLLLLVNPHIVTSSGAEVGREGCLSIPDLTANVRRATEIAVEAATPSGGQVTIESVGFEARCLLHEIDHLDGVLFLDRVDSLKTDVFRRKDYR